MSLLQKAKAVVVEPSERQPGKYRSTDHIELALAWLDGEVTIPQIAEALGISRSLVQPAMESAIMFGLRSKLLRIVSQQPTRR